MPSTPTKRKPRRAYTAAEKAAARETAAKLRRERAVEAMRLEREAARAARVDYAVTLVDRRERVRASGLTARELGLDNVAERFRQAWQMPPSTPFRWQYSAEHDVYVALVSWVEARDVDGELVA